MIDLHSHTTNSDGTWTTKELLMKAEKLKLEALSITDHDTAKSYIEIEKIKLFIDLCHKNKLGIIFEIDISSFDPFEKYLNKYDVNKDA